MLFSEEHHAYLITRLYQKMSAMGEAGIAVFRMAAQSYGGQRGRRMALRALRDGHALDYTAYFAYAEWTPEDSAFDVRMEAKEGMAEEEVFRCPWAAVFAGEGTPDCGITYCREIDRAIIRGFNPDLKLEISRNMHSDGSCRFHFLDERITPDLFDRADMLIKNGETTLPFDYHCGHLLAAFRDVAEDALGSGSARVLLEYVFSGFRGRYGQEMADILEQRLANNYLRLPAEGGKNI